MKTSCIVLAIAVSAAVTFALRALPFAAFRGDRDMPAWLERLGRTLPSAIMAVLVVYCLKDMSFASPAGFLPYLIAGAVVAGLYLWKNNTLLSIVCGTVCYMLLVQLVF